MKNKILLIAIIVLGFTLRVYKINSLPALNADEASIAYNAYSLLKTGRDEHGNFLPIHFQSFNDYKPGGYFYLVLPFVKLFGLSVYSVRLPGIILSTLTIFAIYLLTTELFTKKLGLTAALFLAISPWHIHFSRGAWEVSAATFFMTTGLWAFLKAQKSPRRYYLLSAVFFVFSLYTYHAARVVVPLLGASLFVIYRKALIKSTRYVVVAGLVGFIILLPLAGDLLGPAGISRAAGVGLFADPGPVNRINEQRGAYKNFQGIVPKLFHNKVSNYTFAFLENWAEHFHGEFLFLSGDKIQRNKVPETGQLYLFEIITLLVGLAAIAKKPKNWSPILLWLIFAPIPAALTFQSPHALRAQNMVIPITIISAFGAVAIITYIQKNIKKQSLQATLYMFLIFVFSVNIARYFHMYYVHMAKEYPYSSQYGLKEVVTFVKENQDTYDQIFITDTYDQPYILFLFYLNYPPEKFQKNHTLSPRDQFGFSTVRAFDKYHFGSINLDKIKSNKSKSLVIGTPKEISDNNYLIKTINFPNGQEAFRITESK